MLRKIMLHKSEIIDSAGSGIYRLFCGAAVAFELTVIATVILLILF